MAKVSDKCQLCGDLRMSSRQIKDAPLTKHSFRCETVEVWNDKPIFFPDGSETKGVTLPPSNFMVERRISNRCYERQLAAKDERIKELVEAQLVPGKMQERDQ